MSGSAFTCDHVHSEFATALEAGIWRAAQTGQLQRIIDIVNRSGRVNPADEYGYTPLHYASRGNYIDIVRYLLSQHASVNVQNSGGDTPLHRAAYMGNTGICRMLIERKADINITNSDGQTPLHRANAANKQAVSKLNGDPNVLDKNNMKPEELLRQ